MLSFLPLNGIIVSTTDKTYVQAWWHCSAAMHTIAYLHVRRYPTYWPICYTRVIFMVSDIRYSMRTLISAVGTFLKWVLVRAPHVKPVTVSRTALIMLPCHNIQWVIDVGSGSLYLNYEFNLFWFTCHFMWAIYITTQNCQRLTGNPLRTLIPQYTLVMCAPQYKHINTI